MYTLTIAAGTGGTVNSGGSYVTGSTQTITATPSGGYAFSSWSGSTGCSGLATHNITMDADKTCTANFHSVAIDAPAAPTISASFVSNIATLAVNAVSCSSGTPEYKIRYLRQKLTSDSGWTAWTA